MKAAYSTKGSAVRMRKMRAKRRAELEEMLGLHSQARTAPSQITWHCGCGTQVVVFEQSAGIALERWVRHRSNCLFARQAFPVQVERKAGGAE